MAGRRRDRNLQDFCILVGRLEGRLDGMSLSVETHGTADEKTNFHPFVFLAVPPEVEPPSELGAEVFGCTWPVGDIVILSSAGLTLAPPPKLFSMMSMLKDSSRRFSSFGIKPFLRQVVLEDPRAASARRKFWPAEKIRHGSPLRWSGLASKLYHQT